MAKLKMVINKAAPRQSWVCCALHLSKLIHD